MNSNNCDYDDSSNSCFIVVVPVFRFVVILAILVLIVNKDILTEPNYLGPLVLCLLGVDLLFIVILVCGVSRNSTFLLTLWMCYAFTLLLIGVFALFLCASAVIEIFFIKDSMLPECIMFMLVLLHCSSIVVVGSYMNCMPLTTEQSRQSLNDEEV